MKLPAARRALGQDVYSEGLLKDDFPDLFAELALAAARLERPKALPGRAMG